ncbi:helix-turn-helix transcriptional regulator [Stutzerimonas chloritidismutans]
MPSASTRSALNRQWELLRLLPSKAPGITCAELVIRLASAGFKASKRTVERDLNDLSRQFPLQCNDKGIPYGWHWAPGASVDLPGISLSEAVSLVLVEESIRKLLPSSMLRALEPRFGHARCKLERLASETQAARWPEKVASVHPNMNLISPQIPEVVIERLHEALLTERQVRCSYYSAHNDKLRELILNPLAVVQRGPVSYLIGTAEPYRDIRQYAVHRFQDVELLSVPASGVDAFSLDDYLKSDALSFGRLESIQLVADVTEGLARLIRETPLGPDMTLNPTADGFQLRVGVRDTWQLRWWILSMGDDILVQAPESLRDGIARKLNAAASRYDRSCVVNPSAAELTT